MTRWAVYKRDEFVGYVWANDEADAKEAALLEYGIGVEVERAA